ncbi:MULTISPECIES: GGDEF domain-containing protein [Cohnella]|uniref:GGDEF domain-containing protein n=1 Tax=Cohnella TaxID=329857 RepID=UPI0009B943DA|nr:MULTISPECIES: GGDEF domain-containing protein [Cohnella]MBN2984762.1 GGDEF domain-containing protein [Cohnella algarum]
MNSAAFWENNLNLLHPFSSLISFILLFLMLFMAYRLHMQTRRRTYLDLLVALALCLAHQIFELAIAVGGGEQALLVFVSDALNVASFIVVNFSIFELYHKKRSRTRAWFYSLLGIGASIAVTGLFAGTESLAQLWENGTKAAPVFDIYLLVLCPLFGLMFAPHIGQRVRYVVSLAIAALLHLLQLASRFFDLGSLFYSSLSALLPIAYFIFLFMILFERVVEILQSAYRSSITDGLTSLFNRRFFSSQLERALRDGLPVGAIFCDIDNFKKLNDTQGHQQADVVLKQAAAILMEETEDVGLAGRYGGEELVAFVSAGGVSPEKVAEAIRARIEKETIVTVSVGVSRAAKGITAEQLMKQADEAMYHSKKTGKNRVTDFASLV